MPYLRKTEKKPHTCVKPSEGCVAGDIWGCPYCGRRWRCRGWPGLGDTGIHYPDWVRRWLPWPAMSVDMFILPEEKG